MIGAGSLVFGKTLMSDFLATPALAGSEYRLMARTHTRLDKMKHFVDRMVIKTLDEIRRMTAEMLEAQAKHLPQFAGKTLRKVPAISIPADVVRQEVPVDPALAIANRFAKLAQA